MRSSENHNRPFRRNASLVLLAITMLLLSAMPGATAVDTEKPYIVDYTPADGANNVPIDTVITIEFSENIKIESLDNLITVRDGRSFMVDKQVSYSNYTFKAILTPVEPLKYSMLYMVSVSPYIKDLANNPIREAIQFTFNTTKEKTPPSVVSTTPSNGVNNVPINTNITVVFSEEMDVASLQTGLVVHDSLENPVVGNLTPGKDAKSVVFDPLFNLGYGQFYRVTVLQTVRDLAANTMVEDYVFEFQVQFEQIPPRVVNMEPQDQDQFVKRTIGVSVKFSEPMNTTSLAGTIIILDPDGESVPTTPMYNADNYTLTVKPDQPLAYQTLYTVEVKQLAKDLAGNLLDREYSITFTTEKKPQEQPRITGRNPAEDSFSWYEGIPVDFSVSASDPNGDILVFAWEVNGETQEGETFSDFSFYPEEGSEGQYKVEVAVMDGITAPVTYYWIVDVVRAEPEDDGGAGTDPFNWFYMGLIIALVVLIALLSLGYISLMDRKREILARTRRRLRPLMMKKDTTPDKPPTYEEMYLRADGVYAKKSPEFKAMAAPGGATVKGKAGTEVTVDTGAVKGDAPQLLDAKEVQIERAKVGPYTKEAPELKKAKVGGPLVCPKCGQKAIEAAHGRIWCDTCGFVE